MCVCGVGVREMTEGTRKIFSRKEQSYKAEYSNDNQGRNYMQSKMAVTWTQHVRTTTQNISVTYN